MTHDPLDAPHPPQKAYSYLRFSTPEQSKGDSFRRQASMAQTYARQHGLELDEGLTFHDVGVSAYRGKNKDVGRLADFMEAVETGLVPQGSVLLVEQLDRISRLAPRRALRVLEDIVDAGVVVVTLNDGKRYSSASLDSEGLDLMISILTFMRANEESATKSRRLSAAWEGRRAQVGTKPLTGIAPAWLRLNADRSGFEVIPERAEIVRRMFALTLEGWGQNRITEALNREGIQPWGRAKHWQRSYVLKVLTNPAVIGTMTPHIMEHDDGKKRRKPLQPIENYFPAVVSPETFADVRAIKETMGAHTKGRKSSKAISNVLAGLAACPACGHTMTRVYKGKRSRPTFVCTRAKAGAGCAYKSVPYAHVEDALTRGLSARLAHGEGVVGEEGLEEAITAADHEVGSLKDQAVTLVDNLSHRRSAALRSRLVSVETKLEAAEEALRGLLERREAASGPLVNARIQKALAALQAPEGAIDAGAANTALRSLFRRVVINWPEGELELEWKQGGSFSIPYTWVSEGPPLAAEDYHGPNGYVGLEDLETGPTGGHVVSGGDVR